MTAAAPPLLEVDDLVVHYHVRGAGTVVRTHETVHAVDGVSFTLEARQTLGLVGESGCGKSTTGRNVLLLEQPTSGRILFEGQDLGTLGARRLTDLRRNMQIVFQDPIAALNPRHTVGQLIGEPLACPQAGTEKTATPAGGGAAGAGGATRGCRLALPARVQWRPMPADRDRPVVSRRAKIARPRRAGIGARCVDPGADPSAADDLQVRLGLSYLFIAHDLAVVGEMSDRVAVMYLGKIVEIADRDSLYARPHHPYTQALFSAVPIPDPRLSRLHHRAVVTGEVPSSLAPPPGCRFHTRCPMAQEVCRVEEPVLERVSDGP